MKVTVNTNTADIDINWDSLPTTLDGGSAILGYYVQRDSGYNSSFIEPGTQISSPSTLTQTFTGLTIGATYRFRVAGYNTIYTTDSLGSSLNFSPILSTILALAPNQITTFYQDLTNLHAGLIALRWTAPSSNGSPISYYVVSKDDGLGVFYEIYRGLTLNFTDTLLIPGASYTYTVQAVNAAGTGIASTSVTGIAGNLPSAPLNVRAVLESSTQIIIAWDIPSDTGSISITGYTVKSDSADLVYDSGTNTTSLTFSKTIATADIGKRFSFKVLAYNQLGNGDYSQDIQLVAADAPDNPTVSLISRGMNWLYLKFTPGTSNGGSILTNYTLFMDQGISGSVFQQIATASPDQVLYNVTNLVTGNTYSFQLYSSNVAHQSATTTTSFLVGVVPDKANDPELVLSQLSSTTTTTGEIEISWVANSDYSGLPILSYNLYIDNKGDGVFGTAISITDLTSLQYTFTGLSDGSEYGIKIQALNAVGAGDYSNIVIFIVAEIPSAPSAPVMDASTLTTITVAWSPPSSDGGTSITGYKLYINDFLSDKFVLIYDGSFTPSILSYTVQNLMAGQPYRFEVIAINRVGESLSSTDATFY